MKSKKGGTFQLLIVTLVIIFALFYMVFGLLGKYNEISKSKAIGERQAELLEVYQRGEKALLYADQSAKMVSEQAIYDFAKNGMLSDKKCGTYKGYAVLDFNNGCEPDINNLQFYLNENLNAYLLNYPDKEIVIPLDNYFFALKSENSRLTITGTADDPITIEEGR